MHRRTAVFVATTVVAVALMTGTAGAVGPHQHSVTNPAGSHPIANGFCNGDFSVGNPQNIAIENFHTKIHAGPAGPEGNVTIGGGACG